MSIKTWLIVPVVAFALAGCLDTKQERTIAGAAGGAVVADALGGNALTGAVVGGAAGYFCDELNVAGCKKR